VIGLAILSQRAQDLEKVKDYAQKIHVASERLLDIVTSILDFSALESGDLQVRHETIDLPKLLTRLAERYGAKAKAKGLVFEMRQSPVISVTMTGDAQRLQQVLDELLSNALKFTQQGKVTFAVVLGENQIEFAVTDSGVGITNEQLEAGFKPFQQADGSSTRRFGGLGLGLALAEHLVKLMGGKLTAESKIGEGTTFRVTLPLPCT
jgi:signal transduction histidine kinase